MIFIVIGIILLFLIVVSIVTYISFRDKDYKKLRSTSWTRMRDAYESTKLVKFPGDPMPNHSMIFYKEKVSVCIYTDDDYNNNNDDKELEEELEEEEIEEEETNDDCVEYEYIRKNNKVIINKDGKKITYKFELISDNELKLTYSGDGFDYMFYYKAALG